MILEPGYVDIPLRFSDLDALGHVNNATWLELVQEGRARAFLAWDAPDTRTWSYLVAQQRIEYLAALEYRLTPLRVELWPTHVGGSSLEIASRVRDHPYDGDTVYVVATTLLVHVDPETGRSARLEPQFAAALREHLAPPPRFRGEPRETRETRETREKDR